MLPVRLLALSVTDSKYVPVCSPTGTSTIIWVWLAVTTFKGVAARTTAGAAVPKSPPEIDSSLPPSITPTDVITGDGVDATSL
jgi:hypothetical protein